MRFARWLLLLSALLFALPAAATDLCFDQEGATLYHFKKVKLPKRPIDAVPIAGVRLGSSGVSGSIFRDQNGQLRLSLITESGACFLSVELDESLAGTASYNCVGGFTDTAVWTPIDCATIVY
jgi:hypothetical protein